MIRRRKGSIKACKSLQEGTGSMQDSYACWEMAKITFRRTQNTSTLGAFVNLV